MNYTGNSLARSQHPSKDLRQRKTVCKAASVSLHEKSKGWDGQNMTLQHPSGFGFKERAEALCAERDSSGTTASDASTIPPTPSDHEDPLIPWKQRCLMDSGLKQNKTSPALVDAPAHTTFLQNRQRPRDVNEGNEPRATSRLDVKATQRRSRDNKIRSVARNRAKQLSKPFLSSPLASKYSLEAHAFSSVIAQQKLRTTREEAYRTVEDVR